MRKRCWLVVLSGLMVLGLIPGLAGAQAVVIKDTSCTFFDFDGRQTFEVPGGVEDLNSIKVITPSQNCNKNVSCHTEFENLDGMAYIFDYDSPHHGTFVSCWVEFYYKDAEGHDIPYTLATENWHQTITPKGKVSLTCHFNDCELPSTPQ